MAASVLMPPFWLGGAIEEYLGGGAGSSSFIVSPFAIPPAKLLPALPVRRSGP